MSATILTSVYAHGGRTARYGDFTAVYMHGGAFITTPTEFVQMQSWARARVSSGNPVRDRATFVDRFETVLARIGSGLASRGSRQQLRRIVKAMEANALMLAEWSVPHNLGESVEIARKQNKPAEPRLAALAPAAAVSAAANETLPSSVTPLVRKS